MDIAAWKSHGSFLFFLAWKSHGDFLTSWPGKVMKVLSLSWPGKAMDYEKMTKVLEFCWEICYYIGFLKGGVTGASFTVFICALLSKIMDISQICL